MAEPQNPLESESSTFKVRATDSGKPNDFAEKEFFIYGTDCVRTISGYVKDSSKDVGISDVTLTFNNGGGSITTNISGFYTHSIYTGWSGTATPAKKGYIFDPPAIPYNNIDSDWVYQNYSATAAYTLTITVSPESGGKVIVSPDKSGYTAGETVTLKAAPNTGYTFDHWEGDITGKQESTEFTIDKDMVIKAVFIIPLIPDIQALPSTYDFGKVRVKKQ